MMIHLLVPEEDMPEIRAREAVDFRIPIIYAPNKTGMGLFVIDTTEENFLYYILKYGKEFVWTR